MLGVSPDTFIETVATTSLLPLDGVTVSQLAVSVAVHVNAPPGFVSDIEIAPGVGFTFTLVVKFRAVGLTERAGMMGGLAMFSVTATVRGLFVAPVAVTVTVPL